jgi:hypothetical protein
VLPLVPPVAAKFPVIPVEPGILSILPITAVLAAKTVRQIKPLPTNSRSRGNGNLRCPNRELNTPNQELYRRMSPVTAEHQKRTRKRPIAPCRPNAIKQKSSRRHDAPKLGFFEVDRAVRAAENAAPAWSAADNHAGPVPQVVACIPAIVEANIINQRGHRSRRTPQLLALQIPGRAQIVRTMVGSFQSPFPGNLQTFSELLNRRRAKSCSKFTLTRYHIFRGNGAFR